MRFVILGDVRRFILIEIRLFLIAVIIEKVQILVFLLVAAHKLEVVAFLLTPVLNLLTFHGGKSLFKYPSL